MSTENDKGVTDEGDKHNSGHLAEKPVGYKQPPVAHQFKKGKSGNPRGRPRKMERSFTPRQTRRDILSIGNSLTTIKTSKGIRKVTVVEAIRLRTVSKALSGHGPSCRYFLKEHSEALLKHGEIHDKYFQILEHMEIEFVLNPKAFGDVSERKRLNGYRKLTRRT